MAPGILVPNQGLNLHPLQQKHEVLTTGLLGESYQVEIFNLCVKFISQFSYGPWILIIVRKAPLLSGFPPVHLHTVHWIAHPLPTGWVPRVYEGLLSLLFFEAVCSCRAVFWITEALLKAFQCLIRLKCPSFSSSFFKVFLVILSALSPHGFYNHPAFLGRAVY